MSVPFNQAIRQVRVAVRAQTIGGVEFTVGPRGKGHRSFDRDQSAAHLLFQEIALTDFQPTITGPVSTLAEGLQPAPMLMLGVGSWRFTK